MGHGIYIHLFVCWSHFALPQPVFTDTYLYDEQSLEEIFAIAETKPLPPKWELVLDLGEYQDANEHVCYYYFVNPANRSLFWLEDFNVSPLLWGLCHGKSMSRIHEPESSLPYHNYPVTH